MTYVVHALGALSWSPLCPSFFSHWLEEHCSIFWIQEARIREVKGLAHSARNCGVLSTTVFTLVLLAGFTQNLP